MLRAAGGGIPLAGASKPLGGGRCSRQMHFPIHVGEAVVPHPKGCGHVQGFDLKAAALSTESFELPDFSKRGFRQ